jgi:large subunit ribosomal protein L10
MKVGGDAHIAPQKERSRMSKEAIEKKSAIVSEIKERFDKAESAVAVDYIGLTVEQTTDMRAKLREANVDYRIYKNTLIKRAIDGTDYEKLSGALEGPTALAFGYEDATAPARIINSAIKEYGKMAFKIGVVSGETYDADSLVKLAGIPSRDVLLAKLLGSIKAPVGAFARVLAAIADKDGDTPADDAPAPEKADAPAEAKTEAPAPADDKPAAKEAPEKTEEK